MSAAITIDSRFDHLEDYIDRHIVNGPSFFFSGRPYPWNDENSPDLARSDAKSLRDIHRGIIYLMKIGESNISKAIKRFDWRTGVVYTQVDHDLDYSDFRYWLSPEQPFYCINSEKRVYKCISNNYGTASTSEPTGINTGLTLTADGYIWKFMFDLSTTIEENFLTANWIPVPEGANRTATHLAVVAAAIDGGIQYIRIDDHGSEYTIAPTVVIEGDGTGCEATALLSAGSVSSIIVTNPGTGYTYANVTLYGQNPSAKATAMISPVGGHGFDAVRELCALWLEFSVELKGDTEGYPAWSTYRQVGLINQPKNLSNANITAAWINTLTELDIEFATGTFNQNEYVIGQTSEARAKVYYDEPGNDSSVFVYDVEGTFVEGEIIHGQISEVNATFHTAETVYSTVDLDSGMVLYNENIKFITRNSLLIEKFVFTIEF